MPKAHIHISIAYLELKITSYKRYKHRRNSHISPCLSRNVSLMPVDFDDYKMLALFNR